MRPLERRGTIATWSDTQIEAGDQWRAKIQASMVGAHAAILLVTPGFLASDFINQVELPALLNAAEQGLVLIPIFIKYCHLPDTHPLLTVYQGINSPTEPLAERGEGEQQRIWAKLAQRVEQVAVARTSTRRHSAHGTLAGNWLPHDPNPYFTGREEILARLQKEFASRSRIALGGIAGVGKTEIAIQYVHLHAAEYDHVFWVNAETRSLLISGLTRIAAVLGLRTADDGDEDTAVARVREWLSLHQKWMLVFDNADDLAEVREFFPPGRFGHILLTTRATVSGGNPRVIEIKEMPPQTGALFLLRRAGILTDDTPQTAASAVDQKSSQELSELLGGLALALDQAGAYMEEARCGPHEYIRLYRTAGTSLRAKRGENADRHRDSVTRTFQLAFSRVADASPAAADLLRVCAFFGPDAIPEEVLTIGRSRFGERLSQALADDLERFDVIREACRYSLLHRDIDNNTLSMHRIAQEVLRDAMGESARRDWVGRVVGGLVAALPESGTRFWTATERMFPHLLAGALLVQQFKLETREAGHLLNQVGEWLWYRGRCPEAEQAYRQSLMIREKISGPDHPEVAECLSNLAIIHRASERYPEAELLYKRTLAIDETYYGKDHPEVATDLSNLGVLYHYQKRFEEAEPLHRRALDIRERKLGSTHSDTAQSLNNLAATYKAQRRLADAEPLYKRSLQIRVKVLGLEHPTTALGLHNLGSLYSELGNLPDAEAHLRGALQIRERTLGAQHPDTILTSNQYANVLRELGRSAEADRVVARLGPVPS